MQQVAVKEVQPNSSVSVSTAVEVGSNQAGGSAGSVIERRGVQVRLNVEPYVSMWRRSQPYRTLSPLTVST
jgi:hypothetical protein